MDGSSSQRVAGDQGDLPDSPSSVVGGQASHAPPIHQQEPTMGGTTDILQQIAQAFQRAVHKVAVAPQWLAIERMARYRPIDFMGKKDDEPTMAENWLERTK